MRWLINYCVRRFESDSRWAMRVAAAGGCGLLLAICCAWRMRNDVSLRVITTILLACPLFYLTAGAFLATADTIRQRLHTGKPVGLILRILFGSGIWSVLVWLIILLIVGFPLAIWIGSMTYTRPAG